MARTLISLILSMALLACGGQPPVPTSRASEADPRFPGFLPGYLAREALVDSLALLPPPPAAGSSAQAADDEARRLAMRWRDTPRWKWAAQDAELRFPQAAGGFACALGIPVTKEATPNLVTLLQRTLADAGLATYRAKDHYKRSRPFVASGEPMCDPAHETMLRNDGSYPSGHSAIGMAWALVLADLAPDRVDPLLQRGLAFGQSRVVCNVHWQSDVDAGRLVAAAVVAQLHAKPEFVAQLSAARAEVNAARAAGLRPDSDCAVENRELLIR
jgi:acid phosphatase (class A)